MAAPPRPALPSDVPIEMVTAWLARLNHLCDDVSFGLPPISIVNVLHGVITDMRAAHPHPAPPC